MNLSPTGIYKDFKSIKDNYIKTVAFPLDVLAALPLDMGSVLVSWGTICSKYVYLLSLNKLFRVWRVSVSVGVCA